MRGGREEIEGEREREGETMERGRGGREGEREWSEGRDGREGERGWSEGWDEREGWDVRENKVRVIKSVVSWYGRSVVWTRFKGRGCRVQAFLNFGAGSYTSLLCNFLRLTRDYIIRQFTCKYQAKSGDKQGAPSPLNLQVRSKLDIQ